MDIARVFNNLRSKAKFKDNMVNMFSLATIAKTFIGTMPTQVEMDTEWTRIQAEDIPKENIIMELVKTDLGMIRVIEDIYEKVVNGVEIPQESLDKIANRKTLRDQL